MTVDVRTDTDAQPSDLLCRGYRLRPGAWHRGTAAEPDRTICGIAEDGAGNFWCVPLGFTAPGKARFDHHLDGRVTACRGRPVPAPSARDR